MRVEASIRVRVVRVRGGKGSKATLRGETKEAEKTWKLQMSR
jgi:hypothetical protein